MSNITYASLPHSQISPGHVSYQVRCNYAEEEEDQQVCEQTFPFNIEGDDETQVMPLEHCRDLVTLEHHRPLFVMCLPINHGQNIELEEVDDLEDLDSDEHANETATVVSLNMAVEGSVKITRCPNITVRQEIRPKARQDTIAMPRVSIRKYRELEKIDRPSIKFSTCTALYTPARPGHEWSKYGPSEGVTHSLSKDHSNLFRNSPGPSYGSSAGLRYNNRRSSYCPSDFSSISP